MLLVMNSPSASSHPWQRPRRVAVVGAGMPGLATAWFLQEHDVEVTVFDKSGVAGGATWGNAGWLSPAMTAPLPEPAVLRYGIKALFDPGSPVVVALRPDLGLLRFLVGFARNSTTARWNQGVRHYTPLVEEAIGAFKLLTEADVGAATFRETSILAAARTERELEGMVHELQAVRDLGRDVAFDLLSGDELRKLEPALSDEIGCGVRILDQASINPGAFAAALGESVVARGGKIRAPETVAEVTDTGPAVMVRLTGGASEAFDAVVLANGAWINGLARPHGVRRIVGAGRGYSFSTNFDVALTQPVYFPFQRVACSPLGDGVRVAGTMEITSPDKSLSPKRIGSIAASVAPLLQGADLSARADVWVGSRPCTSDGLPLVGVTKSPRVFINGGHGMWGVTLGPVSGRLLADQLVTGRPHPQLRPFAPIR